MADIDSLSIEVKIDVTEINDGLRSLSGNIDMLKIEIGDINSNFKGGLDKITSSFEDLKSDIDNIWEEMTLAVKALEAGALTTLNDILGVIQEIKEVTEGSAVADALSIGSDATGILANLKSIFSQTNPSKSATERGTSNNADQPGEDWDIFGDFPTALPMGKSKGQLLLPGPSTPLALPDSVASDNSGKGGGDDSAVSNLVSGIFAGGSDIPSMLPDGEMLQNLSELTVKLKESAAAWAAQMGAKIADKAVDLQIIALYVADYVKAFGATVAQLATSTAGWIANTAAKVASTAAEWAQIAATTAWNALCAVATTVTTAFGAAMTFLTSPIGLVVIAITALIAIVVLLVKNWDTVKAAALSVWEAIKEAFGKAWNWFKETLLDPLVKGFKGMVNGVIGFINGLIAGVVSGINSVIGVLNKLKFSVPDWIPGLGGMTIGFNLKTVTAPQIPLLARGAVLPANKPFLAMVGDQKHGTNIEAPLATIQEAVALVMEDQTAAILSGFEVSVGVQREILEAVLGIQIGDEVIGQAVARHNRKLAVMKGGI